MIIKKPSIFIYVNNPDSSILREVYSGIEEEGVFYEVIEHEESDLNRLAWEAAKDSMLGSGIGIKGTAVALQIRGIAVGQNVDYYAYPTAEECRKLGANSARAIKKQAFK